MNVTIARINAIPRKETPLVMKALPLNNIDLIMEFVTN
jgi:hypothetical protein